MRNLAVGLAIGTIVLTLGCEKPDPATSQLVVGSEVMLAKPDPVGGDSVVVETARGAGLMGLGFGTVKVGTKATVVDDPGGVDPKRKVRINVQAGEAGTIVGTVNREIVRPVP